MKTNKNNCFYIYLIYLLYKMKTKKMIAIAILSATWLAMLNSSAMAFETSSSWITSSYSSFVKNTTFSTEAPSFQDYKKEMERKENEEKMKLATSVNNLDVQKIYEDFKKEFSEQLEKWDFSKIDEKLKWYYADVNYLNSNMNSSAASNIWIYKTKIRMLEELKRNYLKKETIDDSNVQVKPIYIFIQNKDKAWTEYKIKIDFLENENNQIIKNIRPILLEKENQQDNFSINWNAMLLNWKIAGNIDWSMALIQDNNITKIKINWKEIDFLETTRFKTDENIEVIITKGYNEDAKKIMDYAKNSIKTSRDKLDEKREEVKIQNNVKKEENGEKRIEQKEDKNEYKEKMIERQEKEKTEDEKIKFQNKISDEKFEDKKENINTKREEFKNKYRAPLTKKLSSAIDKISDEKLKIVLEKVNLMIVKFEENDKLTEDKKENIIAQLEVLKELINAKINSENDELNFEEILWETVK